MNLRLSTHVIRCFSVEFILIVIMFHFPSEAFASFLSSGGMPVQDAGGANCLATQEIELVKLLNDYRARRGLSKVTASLSLTKVARIHADDLQNNRPDQGKDARGMKCNMHSWSSKGFWKGGCYTGDHLYADLMRQKPRELTANAYDDVGYEAAYWNSNTPIDPQTVIESWLRSSDHRALLFETNKWEGINFVSVGVGFSNNYAVIWIGTLKDPLGSLLPCSQTKQKQL